MKATFIITTILLLLTIDLTSQESKDFSDKNSVSVNWFYLTNPIYTSNFNGIMLNYSRKIYSNNRFSTRIQVGVGKFLNEPPGEAIGFLAELNSNLFVKNYWDFEKHSLIFGLGYDRYLYWYHYEYFLIPIGYSYKIKENFSFDFTLSPIIWTLIKDNDAVHGQHIYNKWYWEMNNFRNIFCDFGITFSF